MPSAPPCDGHLDGLLHRAAEARALLQLLGDALGDQLGVDLGLGDLDDVHVDLLAGQRLELPAELVYLGALAADDEARTRAVQEDVDLLALALDLDLRDAGELVLALDELADVEVLDQEVLELALRRVPALAPVLGDPEPEARRQYFLPHYYSSWVSICSTITVMWLVRLRIGCAIPRRHGDEALRADSDRPAVNAHA